MPALFKGLKETQKAVNLEFFPNEFITHSKHTVFSLDNWCLKYWVLCFQVGLGVSCRNGKEIKMRNIYFVLNWAGHSSWVFETGEITMERVMLFSKTTDILENKAAARKH